MAGGDDSQQCAGGLEALGVGLSGAPSLSLPLSTGRADPPPARSCSSFVLVVTQYPSLPLTAAERTLQKVNLRGPADIRQQGGT